MVVIESATRSSKVKTMSGTIVSGSIDNQARFESMRNHGSRMKIFHRPHHNSRVFRRHIDLDRECERKVKMYAKETRLMTDKIARHQKEVLDKQRELEAVDEDVAQHQTTNPVNKHQVVVPPPKLHKEKKDVLLFRIRHVGGKKVYIKEAVKQQSRSVQL